MFVVDARYNQFDCLLCRLCAKAAYRVFMISFFPITNIFRRNYYYIRNKFFIFSLCCRCCPFSVCLLQSLALRLHLRIRFFVLLPHRNAFVDRIFLLSIIISRLLVVWSKIVDFIHSLSFFLSLIGFRHIGTHSAVRYTVYALREYIDGHDVM